MTSLRTETVDLEAVAAEYWNEVAELKEARADAYAKAEEEVGDDGDYEDLPPDARSRIESLVERYNEKVKNHAASAETFSHYAEQWGGSEFVVKEPNANELAYTVDETRAESLEIDFETGDVEGTPREMYSQILALRNGVIDSPAQAPDDVGELPGRIMQLLYERLDDIGAPDDAELGNMSLREAMAQE
jgi:chorismate mutase